MTALVRLATVVESETRAARIAERQAQLASFRELALALDLEPLNEPARELLRDVGLPLATVKEAVKLPDHPRKGVLHDRVQPCAHSAPTEPWMDADRWIHCGVCHPKPVAYGARAVR